MPKVSILMVTYNREKYIKDALESVLKQSFKDFEIVIVDDCSCDNTFFIVDRYIKDGMPIVYKKNDKNIGIFNSRNVALSFCSGEYVAILDSDDIWIDENKLKKQVDFLEENKEYLICGSMASLIDEKNNVFGSLIFRSSDKVIRNKILFSNQFIHSSVVYRRDKVVSIGGYGEYTIGEDYDLFLRIGLIGKFFNFSDKMIYYRKHSGGITWSKRFVAAKNHLKIIKKYKGKYPNYFFAVFKAYLRLFFYTIHICIV